MCGDGGFVEIEEVEVGAVEPAANIEALTVEELTVLIGEDYADAAAVDGETGLGGGGAAEVEVAAVASVEPGWQPGGEAERALLAQLLAEERAAASETVARDVMIDAINALPINGAHERDASFKLRKSLQVVAKIWADYLDERLSSHRL